MFFYLTSFLVFLPFKGNYYTQAYSEFASQSFLLELTQKIRVIEGTVFHDNALQAVHSTNTGSVFFSILCLRAACCYNPRAQFVRSETSAKGLYF